MDTGQSGLDSPLLKAMLASQQSQYAQNSGGMGVIAQLLSTFMGQYGKKAGDVTQDLPVGTTPLTDGNS